MNFTDLEAWKKAREFRNSMFQLSKTFPASEKFALYDQLVRASRAITANIAEGHGRYHLQENIQFCRIARGSLSECLDHLFCALDCQYLSETEFHQIRGRVEEINRILNGYINYLKDQKLR